ncbi:hypothetical protein [Desulfovibrio gilichinskyi]|uniref:Uncharacterized protein n=1 Tax=Desulfovibrio gilichinskyi TaxID=1519643 RepID=A0A1X7C3L5_9BACT|nr:hypothetical protein [Desulfovibrio gilichinskyi]SME89396.1 hypothetical protein SAMN06295933_0293 [Desulfovibrio gilichinskyi]
MEFDENGNPIEGTAPESNDEAQDVQEVEVFETPENEIGSLFDKVEQDADGKLEAPEANSEETNVDAQPEVNQEVTPAPTFKIKVQGVEREVTADEMTRLAQQGEDYSLKMQRLNNERLRLESVQPLANAWQNDPAFRQHVMEYQRQQEQQKVQPLPEDPIEALKEEAVREAMARIEAQQHEQVQARQATERTTQISRAMHAISADELRENVMAEMSKVAPAGSALRARLNNDPDLFFPTYMETRQRLANAPKGPAPQAPAVPAGGPNGSKVVRVAPILESGGSEAPANGPTKKERARALREKAAGGDLRSAGQLFDLVDD